MLTVCITRDVPKISFGEDYVEISFSLTNVGAEGYHHFIPYGENGTRRPNSLTRKEIVFRKKVFFTPL